MTNLLHVLIVISSDDLSSRYKNFLIRKYCINAVLATSLLSDNSECAPPDPIPNSEVKPLSADGSVGSPHVRVGHC